MKRRTFAMLAGGAATWPVSAIAQQKKVPRIGILWHAADANEESDYLPVVEKAFADLGYVNGKTVELLHRFPAEQPERFRAMARELADSRVDVIVAITILGGLVSATLLDTFVTPILFHRYGRPALERLRAEAAERQAAAGAAGHRPAIETF